MMSARGPDFLSARFQISSVPDFKLFLISRLPDFKAS